MMHRLVQSFGRDLLGQGKKEDVPNPKTMPLDKLVQKIEQRLLVYYLDQVFSFLPSVKKDLWFPQISQELDAFLVRIVRDEENLRSVLDILDEKSRQLAEGILEALRENENLYRLNYTYESSKLNKNTLVYRKVYIDKAVEIQRCKVSPPKIVPPTGEVKLKGQWLSAILRFAQDNDMDTLDYPEMTLTEAEALAACISMRNPDVRLKSLWEAVNACKENYELKISYLHLGCEKVRLMVEKTPLNNNIKVNEKREDKDKGLTKAQRNFQKKRELVHSLGTGFIKAALQMILDFVNNDSETTLVFKNGNEDQCAFIHSACSMAKNSRMHSLFEEQEQVYLRKIATVLNNLKPNNRYELKGDVMKIDRGTQLRNVLLIKDPKDEGQKVGNCDQDGALDMSPELSDSYPMDCSNTEDINVSDMENKQSQKILTKEEIEKKLLTVNSKFKVVDFTKATTTDNDKKIEKVDDYKPILNPKEILAKIIELVEPIDDKEESTPQTSFGKSQIKDNSKTIDKAQAVESVRTVNNQPKPSTSLLTQTFTATKLPTIDISKSVDISKAMDNALNSKVVNYKITIGNPLDIDITDKIINNPLGLDYAKAIDQAKNIGKVHKENLNKMEIDKVTVKTYVKPTAAEKHVSKAKAGENARVNEKNKHSEAANALAKAVEKEYGKPIENKDACKVPREQSDGRPLPARKAKLLEAMSVPMESDRAMRMMRQMGWEGGPLGTRGEGITEPIVPALHITTGAGLGHVKPKKDPPAKCKNYRLDILKNIHLLLLEEPLKRTVLYPNQISKKERGFLLHAVKAFNRRSSLQMNDEELQGMVRLIMSEMTNDHRLQIFAALHEDKRTVTLSKNEIEPPAGPPQPPRLPPAPPPEGVMAILAKHSKSGFITTDTVAAVGQALMPGVVGKAAKALGHKVVLLSKILELVKSSTCHKNITFQYALTLKQVNFLKELLVSINLRSKVSYSVYENYLVGEIVKIADDSVFLTHEFGSTNQSMTLFKKSSQCQKRPFNNAKEEQQNNKVENTEENDKKSKDNNKETEKFDVRNVKAADDDEVSSAKDVNDACVKLNDLKLAKDDVEYMEIDKCDSKVDDVIDKATDAKSDSAAKDVVVSKGNESVKKDATDNGEVIKKADDNIDREANTSKRIRTDSDEANGNRKKAKSQIPKYLCIAPDSYPIDEVDFDIICTFQNLICDKLEKDPEKPFLECVGLKNGALIYGCHNEYGRIVIESVANDLDLKTTNITNLYKDRKRYKVTGRMNSYLDIDLKKLLDTLVEYNEGLKTDSWNVIEVKINKGNIELLIEVDFNSFDYISQHGFGLYAGLDKIRFSVVWD